MDRAGTHLAKKWGTDVGRIGAAGEIDGRTPMREDGTLPARCDTSGERERYDNRRGPNERDNPLVAWEVHIPDPDAEAEAIGLKARLDAFRDCSGASCLGRAISSMDGVT